jgi:hypothetical protein
MPSFYLRQNEAKVIMRANLLNEDGTPIDLTDATVHFQMGYEGDTEMLVDGLCSIVDAEGGRVSYTWTAENTDLEPGEFDGEFEIDWPDGTHRKVPSKKGAFKIVVSAEVG